MLRGVKWLLIRGVQHNNYISWGQHIKFKVCKAHHMLPGSGVVRSQMTTHVSENILFRGVGGVRGLAACSPCKFLHFRATQAGTEAIFRPFEMPPVVVPGHDFCRKSCMQYRTLPLMTNL